MGDEAEAQLAHISGGHHVPDYGDGAFTVPFHDADNPPPLHPYTCGGQQNGCLTCEQEPVSTDAEVQVFHAAMDAAEIADRMARSVTAVLARNEHAFCGLQEYAATTLHEGVTVVLCGCGEFFEAPELAAPTVKLPPERVDAHGPAAVTVAAADPIARTLDLIQPGQDYTPEQVERLMLDAVQRLEEGQAFERWALEQASEAQRAYNRAYSLAFVKTSGPMELRRNVAEVECAALADAKDTAEMVHKAAKTAMHNLRSTLSGYQSVLKSVQATYTAGGSSGGRAY